MTAGHDPAPCRVLLVYQTALLFQGIRTFLTDAPDIQVVGVEHEACHAAEAVRQLHANVVVLEDPLAGAPTDLLATLLAVPGARRIVTLGPGSTRAQVDERYVVRADDPAALVAAIRGERPAGPDGLPRVPQDRGAR
jgi:DNA-binding NarL/FixJ family response regulator